MRGGSGRRAAALLSVSLLLLLVRPAPALRENILLHTELPWAAARRDPYAEAFGGDQHFAPGVLRGREQVERWAASFLEARSAAHPERPDDTTEKASLPWELNSDLRPLAHCGNAIGPAEAGAVDHGGDAEHTPEVSLQKALRFFCDAKLGPLTEFYVDPAYAVNHERHRDKDGWLDQAFVTYMGLKKEHDKIGAEEDLLVQSVHHFSTRPVVVANFGTRVPKRWTAERYPNLVLMHARSSEMAGKSFNFNKFSAMLFTKVKSGMVLDADQFVNRGLDSLLQRAGQETNQHYPYPIMPVHWMSRDPEDSDMQAYPFGYSWHFNSEEAPRQNMRWGHAHPTFGHHALPWLAKWTSFALAAPEFAKAPQWLTDQGWIEDEDLLNVALWASNATKQWCKFDIPSPSDFGKYLGQTPDKMLMFQDKKYYPKGIPFVFFTAHDAKKPVESYLWLRKLWNDDGSKHKAILYDGEWFETEHELKRHDPSLRCII